jgi:hypothetical protein
MSLIDNLNAINSCKEDIKSALVEKGVDMSDVSFSGYAEKIASLQIESGGSTTTPSDCIYTNGYPDGAEANEIIDFAPYEISLDSEGKFSIEVTCPIEIPVYTFENYDIIFAFDVPTTYDVIGLEYYDELNNDFEAMEWDTNPRHATIVRDGITYNSYVRKTEDGYMGNENEISISTVQYRITIEKK